MSVTVCMCVHMLSTHASKSTQSGIWLIWCLSRAAKYVSCVCDSTSMSVCVYYHHKELLWTNNLVCKQYDLSKSTWELWRSLYGAFYASTVVEHILLNVNCVYGCMNTVGALPLGQENVFTSRKVCKCGIWDGKECPVYRGVLISEITVPLYLEVEKVCKHGVWECKNRPIYHMSLFTRDLDLELSRSI